jgi:4-hydroxybenzoate polyprenyltransferase
MPNPYFRLLRLHQPTGVWLLLWPCWWSIALASHGLPPLMLLALFAVGAVVMRGAGCIVNDMADRDFDRHVERTRTRPLASGEITLRQAAALLLLLLCIALAIALQLNRYTLLLAASSLGLVAAYPFMKRITWWPQAFLGLTFNWGALMGWAAVKGTLGWPALALYAGGIFWTLGYDTVYAHQDTADDITVGVKSTALRLGAKSRQWITGFYALAVLFWVTAGALNHDGIIYLLGMFAVGMHCIWQMRNVDFSNAASCMRIFRSNVTLGWIMFMVIVADRMAA